MVNSLHGTSDRTETSSYESWLCVEKMSATFFCSVATSEHFTRPRCSRATCPLGTRPRVTAAVRIELASRTPDDDARHTGPRGGRGAEDGAASTASSGALRRRPRPCNRRSSPSAIRSAHACPSPREAGAAALILGAARLDRLDSRRALLARLVVLISARDTAARAVLDGLIRLLYKDQYTTDSLPWRCSRFFSWPTWACAAAAAARPRQIPLYRRPRPHASASALLVIAVLELLLHLLILTAGSDVGAGRVTALRLFFFAPLQACWSVPARTS